MFRRARVTSSAERATTVGKVLNLVGVAFVFTAAGALVGQIVGHPPVLVSAIGGLALLLLLVWQRERSPLNLGLLYAFSPIEGLVLGSVVEQYIAEGLSGTVMYAGGATAVVTFIAGFYEATTKRDLTGFGPLLFIGLIAVILAYIAALFIPVPLFTQAIGAVSAVLFTGYIIYDLNRTAKAIDPTEGQVIPAGGQRLPRHCEPAP